MGEVNDAGMRVLDLLSLSRPNEAERWATVDDIATPELAIAVARCMYGEVSSAIYNLQPAWRQHAGWCAD